jgi:hypothetical protein
MVQPDRPQMTVWRKRFACQITKVTDTHSEYIILSGFGGLGVACWPLVPKFTGSNPAEARLPSEGK